MNSGELKRALCSYLGPKNTVFISLARWRRPPAAFLLNGAITRGANGTKTFRQTYPSYMQSFIKIGGAVLEKSVIKIMTMCNFNKDRPPFHCLKLSFIVDLCEHIAKFLTLSLKEFDFI